MRHETYIPLPREVEIHSRGRLPHWWTDDAMYFITFRLADSLPREVVLRLAKERDYALKNAVNRAQKATVYRLYEEQLDAYLDRGFGSCLLREHGEVVAGALRFFDGKRYELHAWCVMPNHVHVLVHFQRGSDLPRILHSWKSFTAHEIDRGHIWEREYFDRCVRTLREYGETADYIRRNPAAAGLQDWRWIG